jgi:hypothetical protein
VPTAAGGGGYLIQALSDQQWCLHWLLCLDAARNEALLTSTEPIGINLPGDEKAPRVIPLDGEAMGLDVCADTFAEFLYRFWIENEIVFSICPRPRALPAGSRHSVSQ